MRCLDALWSQEQVIEGFEVIVVDDGSTDDTGEYLHAQLPAHPNLQVLFQKNKGPASARNLGASRACGQFIAFTDDDCIVSTGWLRAVREGFSDPAVLAIEGPVDGSSLSGRPFHPLDHVIHNQRPGGYLSCNLAIKKEVFEQLGGFDVRFRMAAHEDIDLCLRVLECGRIGYCNALSVRHPPVRRCFLKELFSAGKFCRRFLESEYLLYHKHPGGYGRMRYHKSFLKTLSHLCLKYAFLYSRVPLRSAVRFPLGYGALLLLNLFRQLALTGWFVISPFYLSKITDRAE
jgi:glycosyltransferase involved in cell wall biosynthesis